MKQLLFKIANQVESIVKKNIHNKKSKRVIKVNKNGEETKLIDEIAEKVIIKIVGKKFNILSEEIGFIDNKAEKTIIVDPIDGTFNAINNFPIYSISLAIGKDFLSNVEFALVRNLITTETFYTEKGKGAFLNGKKIKVKEFQKDNSIFSIYLSKNASQQSYEIAKIPRRVRSVGCASLELCFVAKGTFDLYYQVGYPLRIVDIAGGVLILREAKGEVYNEKKEILDLPFTLDKRANIIAVGDKKILELIP